jgi:hypothetical protein
MTNKKSTLQVNDQTYCHCFLGSKLIIFETQYERFSLDRTYLIPDPFLQLVNSNWPIKVNLAVDITP